VYCESGGGALNVGLVYGHGDGGIVVFEAWQAPAPEFPRGSVSRLNCLYWRSYFGTLLSLTKSRCNRVTSGDSTAAPGPNLT
jgi:hypothetical protein